MSSVQDEVVLDSFSTRRSSALGLEKLPAPSEANWTVPCGHDLVPLSVSATTTVQVVLSAIGTELGEQPLTVVEVERLLTVRVTPLLSLLSAWIESLAV